jgi:hypothetical protein
MPLEIALPEGFVSLSARQDGSEISLEDFQVERDTEIEIFATRGAFVSGVVTTEGGRTWRMRSLR